MNDAFLFVPERLAGYPVTLEEAAHGLGVGKLSAYERAFLSSEKRDLYGHHSRRAILLSLVGGTLHAFVQDYASGAWYRIPPRYWLPAGQQLSDVLERPYLPSLLERREHVVIPNANSLIGQAVVVWREDAERLAVNNAALGAQMLAANAGATVKDVAEPAPSSDESDRSPRGRGRPAGTDQYPGDPAIVARVIALCENHDFVGTSRVRRATQSLVSEIEGGALADESKIRRIVGKVKKLRPNLAF